MSDRKPYSRVYWEVLDDAKFDAICADMRHFGSWTLMLVLADMAYPAPTFVPPTVSRASLAALVAAELVDVLPARMYRIRGLKGEREKRAAAARRSPNRVPDAPQPGPVREADGRVDETRRDETSKGNRRDNARADSQERPAPANEVSRRRFDRMVQQRHEWWQSGGAWDPDWGPEPERQTA